MSNEKPDQLKRYGLEWPSPGEQVIAVAMEDGYWTPWHVAESKLREAVEDRDRLDSLVNNPHIKEFAEAVRLEAAHQRERWGAAHDAGKQSQDWFWLIGYLAGKALAADKSGDKDKALHHTISTAAVLANWHAALTGEHTEFRPGIDPAEHGVLEGLG